VVTGGLSAGGASYFGGAVSVIGNLGVGTTSPAQKVDVRGSLLVNTDGGFYSATGNSLFFGVDATPVNVAAIKPFGLGNDTYGLSFFGHNGSSLGERMRMLGNGNVLIGTMTDAGQKFQVSGTATFAGAVTAAGLVTAGQVANVSATNSILAKGYAVGGYGDYGSILLSASAANTSGARQFLVTNAHNATGFAIIRSANATTPPTLDTNGVVSSGTVDFAISNAGAATFAGAVTVGGNFTGTSSETKIQSSATAARIRISGGTENDGAGVILGGSTDGGIPNTGILAMAGSTIASWNSSALTMASGKALKLGNPYVGGAAVGTGTITIQDSTGTTYRIPVLV
jgi:hypothetical protein